MRTLLVTAVVAIAFCIGCSNGSDGTPSADSSGMQNTPNNTRMGDTSARAGDTSSYERMPQRTDSTQ